MKKSVAQKILQETESGYDAIAQKFSQTRKHFWRGLEFIADYVREDDQVLDFGCGNGRLLELFAQKKIKYQGVDISRKLLDLAQERYPAEQDNFAKLDPGQTTLAFKDDFFNATYSIAVFHHFPSRAYRRALAQELLRVTAEGGRVVVTVWYLWQRKYLKNILRNWALKFLGFSRLDWNDCQISFTDNMGTKIQRFHHAFARRELQKLFAEAGFVIEKCEVVDGRNIVLIGKKERTR